MNAGDIDVNIEEKDLLYLLFICTFHQKTFFEQNIIHQNFGHVLES